MLSVLRPFYTCAETPVITYRLIALQETVLKCAQQLDAETPVVILYCSAMNSPGIYVP